MKYEIWTLDRDGERHKILAATDFNDVAECVALALADRFDPMDSRVFGSLFSIGERRLLVTEDGIPYKHIQVTEERKKKWTAVLAR